MSGYRFGTEGGARSLSEKEMTGLVATVMSATDRGPCPVVSSLGNPGGLSGGLSS